MVLMVVCAALVAAGVAAVVIWGDLGVVEVPIDGAGEEGSIPVAESAARRLARLLAIAIVSGFGAGALVAGAGGRLAMRLLAVTSGAAAQGRLTEANETVGRISGSGTFGFIFFTAVFLGTASGVVFLLIRRWLPSGRLGGLAFGALLLALFATRLEPLRANNPDFDLVGPRWLAVTVFSALVLVHGMAVSALAGRYSRAFARQRGPRGQLVPYTPVLLLAPFGPVALITLVVGGIGVGLSRVDLVQRAWRSPTCTRVGRWVLAGSIAVCAPGAVSALIDIVRS
jgi:hypothetical protein